MRDSRLSGTVDSQSFHAGAQCGGRNIEQPGSATFAGHPPTGGFESAHYVSAFYFLQFLDGHDSFTIIRVGRVCAFAIPASCRKGIGRLLGELAEPGEPSSLLTLAGERLDALLRPDGCVVYARAGPGYEPVFVRGRAVPPALLGRSPLISTLEDRAAPLTSDGFSRRDRLEQLSPFDRAALETLGVVAVVPIRRRLDLVAFLCLGPKQSGDIYTATDLALLTAVADRVSMRLDRFDQDQVDRIYELGCLA